MVLSAIAVDRAGARERAAQGPDHHLVQDLAAARPDRRSTARSRKQTEQPLHLGLTEAGMGTKGLVWSAAAMGVLLQRGHRRHHSRVADAAPRRRPPRRGLRGVRAAAGARPAHVRAERDRLPRLRPHDQHTFQELAERVQDYIREQMPEWKTTLRRRRDADAGGHGLRRQRPRRIEGRQHRHLPARHRRSAELPGLHRRRALRHAARHLRGAGARRSSTWSTTTSTAPTPASTSTQLKPGSRSEPNRFGVVTGC